MHRGPALSWLLLLVAGAVGCGGGGGGGGSGGGGSGGAAASAGPPGPPPLLEHFSPSLDYRVVGGQSVTFMVVPEDESDGPFEFNWSIDGAPIGGSSSCLPLFTSPHDPPQRTVAVEVTTRGGPPSSLVWNLNVLPAAGANVAPAVLSTAPEGPVSIRSTEEVTLAVIATDPDSVSPLTYRWSVDGEAIDEGSSKITLSGEGLGAGDHQAEVIVSDRGGLVADDTAKWKVHVAGNYAENRPPVISRPTPLGPVRVATGTFLRMKVAATDPEDNPLSYRWEVDGVPQGEQGAIFQFAPAAPGSYSVRASAQDQEGPGEPSSFSWKVEVSGIGPPPAPELPSIEIAWDPVVADLEGQTENLSGYLVYTSESPDDFDTPMETGLAAGARIYHLTSGVTYYIAVTAYDVGGNESGFSGPVSFQAP